MEITSTLKGIDGDYNQKKSSHIFDTQNSQENTFARVSFLIKLQAQVCNFIKKETLEQVFSCEFCEISKHTFFTEHFWATASANAIQIIIIIWTNTRCSFQF